jgi:pimeloyl-ACP methyl ester carboxylesterase
VEVSEHTVEVGGQPVYWRSAPCEGTPTLYVHGVPTSSEDWVPLLARGGGLAPDLFGFGRSGKGGQLDFSLEGIAAFVERFLDEIVELERVKLVVHDWGAAALAFAMRAPERVERLVVIDAVPLLPGYRWHRIARVWRTPFVGELAMGLTFEWTMRRAFQRAFAEPVPDAFVRAAWRAFDQGTQRSILRLYRSAPEESLARAGAELERIDCPALVVWGALDPYIPARFAQQYAERLPGGRVEVVPNAGHWPWVDRADLVGRIVEFLDET